MDGWRRSRQEYVLVVVRWDERDDTREDAAATGCSADRGAAVAAAASLLDAGVPMRYRCTLADMLEPATEDLRVLETADRSEIRPDSDDKEEDKDPDGAKLIYESFDLSGFLCSGCWSLNELLAVLCPLSLRCCFRRRQA